MNTTYARMTTKELDERIKKLEDQVSWIVSNPAAVSSERVEKLEIQVSCLRKQVLDLEGKKSYREQTNDKVHPRQQRMRSSKEE